MESTAQVTQLDVGSDFAGRYRVVRCLNSGGMGSVYEVLDRKTDRLRALKVMLPDIAGDEDLRQRFLQEASVVGRVCSDHIVEVVDAGIAEPQDIPFLVMDLLRGEDFGAMLEERGRLDAELVVEALSQVALGLDKVHAEGIIHRDLKPENLFATQRDDGSLCVKILDFGVAKVVRHLATLRTTRSLGTPLYMAPEQLSGDSTIDTPADRYSLAHVAYTMLVGKPYWYEEARRVSNAYAFINIVVDGASEPATRRARRFDVELPAAFDKWFAKATAKRVSRRFESAREQIAALAGALHIVASSHPQGALPTPVPTPASTPGRHWLPLLAALALAALALVTLPGLFSSSPAVEPSASANSMPSAALIVTNRTAPSASRSTVAAATTTASVAPSHKASATASPIQPHGGPSAAPHASVATVQRARDPSTTARPSPSSRTPKQGPLTTGAAPVAPAPPAYDPLDDL